MSCPAALERPYPRKAAEGLMHTSSVWKLKRKKISLVPAVQRRHRNRKTAGTLRASENRMQNTEPSLLQVQQSFYTLNSEL